MLHGEDATARDIVLERDAAELLESYPWPGNFRELDRLMERLLFLQREGNRLTADDVRALL